MDTFIHDWRTSIQNVTGPSGRGRNKLKTYTQFKSVYETEKYVECSTLSSKYKCALAKFRCGVAPLRLETGRYENIPEEQRLCPICELAVENEVHVLFHCPLYQSLRNDIVNKAIEIDASFNNLCDQDRLNFVLSNEHMIKVSSKTCFLILKARNNHLYK